MSASEESVRAFLRSQPATRPPDSPVRRALRTAMGAAIGRPYTPPEMAAEQDDIDRMGVQGAAFGLGDELAGLGAALVPGGKGYTEARAASAANLARIRRERPGQAAAAEAIGAIGTGVAGGTLRTAATAARAIEGADAVRKVGVIGRGLRLARGGAIAGGVYGAGNAEPGHRIEGGLEGAAVGAVAAPATAAIGAGIGGVVRPLARLAGRGVRAATGVPTPAARGMEYLLLDAERGGVSPTAAAARLDAATGPMAVADVLGPAAQGRVKVLGSIPSEGSTALRSALESRNQGQYQRLIGSLEESFGLPRGSFVADTESLVAQRAANAAPRYEAARAAGNVDDPLIREALGNRHFRAAYERGRDLADLARQPIPTLEEVTAEGGPGIPVRAIDWMKKGVDSVIRGGADGTGALDRETAKLLRGRLGEVLGRVDEIVPEYGAARRQFADDSELIDAMENGYNALSPAARREPAALPAAGTHAREMYNRGLMQSVVDRLGETAHNRNLVPRVIRNRNEEPVLRAALGDGGYDRLMRSLADEDAMSATHAAVRGGSDTAFKLAGQEEMGGVGPGPLKRIFNVVRHPVESVVEPLDEFFQRSATERSADALSPLLSAGADGDKAAAARTVDALRRLQALRIARAARSAETVKAAAAAAGAHSSGR